METEKLYKLVDELNIKLDFFPLPLNKSMAVNLDNRCYIALDPSAVITPSQERVCLAHELGHCDTGSFYNVYSPFDLRTKHELRADRWAIEKLIPLRELKAAIKQGCSDTASLAEHFSVTEDFIGKALKYYSENSKHGTL